MTSGTTILAAQYVAIQNKAELLLGVGAGSNGYGQPLSSSDVVSGNTIEKTQWDQLRFDIVNIKLHQDGTVPDIAVVAVGDVIQGSGATPVLNYNTLVDQATANKFIVATSQSAVTAKTNQTYSSAWNTNLSSTLTCVFTSANEARHFFNSGGKIRLTTSHTGGSATPQVNAWKNVFAAAGTQSFGAATDPSINYYNLTNVFQTYFLTTLSSPYSANSYRLEASCNVSNNTTGSATQVNIRLTLADSYVDLYPSFGNNDSVDGTVTVSIDELKAAGNLLPAGNFVVTGPSYSLSVITGS